MHNHPLASAAKWSGDRDVNPRGHHVAQAIDGKGGLVTRCGIVPCPKTGGDDVLESLDREGSKTIDAVRDPIDSARLGVVVELLARYTEVPSLSRGEVSALRLGDEVESVSSH